MRHPMVFSLRWTFVLAALPAVLLATASAARAEACRII
jgi:hypothetical protein